MAVGGGYYQQQQPYPPAPGVPLPGPVASAPFQVQSHGPGHWTTGLCDCCDDIENFCITCWCPCITFGQIAEIVDRGSSSCGASGALYCIICTLTGCPCIYSCFYRSKLRAQYSLPDSPCGDCPVHCCCEECALCQEYRELRNRGFDMTIGWQANMEKRAMPAMHVPPPVQGGMIR